MLRLGNLREDNSYSKLREVEVETVLMNPPFGTKNKGIDVAFLKAALRAGLGLTVLDCRHTFSKNRP